MQQIMTDAVEEKQKDRREEEREGATGCPAKPISGELRQTEGQPRQRLNFVGEMMRNDCANILWQYSGSCHTFIFART